MVVQNGRVSWVGAPADLKAPDGATVTDLNGAYVIPGLMDLHAHIGNTVDLVQDKNNHTRESVEKDLRTYASYGVTTVMSMGTDQDTIFPRAQRPALCRRKRVSALSMARVYTAGQGLMFKGGYGGLAGVNTKRWQRRSRPPPQSTRSWIRAPTSSSCGSTRELGTMPKMPPEISKAIIDTAHKRSARVLAHIFYLEDAKRLVDQGIDGFVHSVRDRPIDQALIDSMKEHGTWQVAATLSREAAMFAYGSTPAFADDPFFTRGVSAKTVELIKSPERQKTQASNPNFKKFPAFFENAKANLKRLVDAGIPLRRRHRRRPAGGSPAIRSTGNSS